MSDIGLVAVDTSGKWIGGRYYLHHLVKAVASLPQAERMPMVDVSWQTRPDEDPFKEVRAYMSRSIVLNCPTAINRRLYRKIRRLAHRWNDSRDLFLDAGIGVVFPVLPCAAPGIPYVFWLPDFQYIHLPNLFGDELCKWYENYYRSNVEQATLVVLSSQHAMKDYAISFPHAIDKARIVNFCSIPDETWQRLDPRETAGSIGFDGSFFVLSNQFSHHKNHETVFDAVRILKCRGIDITVLCTGSTYGFRGDDYLKRLKDFIKNNKLEKNIVILGMLPRDEQIALMRRSLAMLQPSHFEGWSTVVEDARALGKTLLVSDIEVHREQLGETYPLYLHPDDSDAWADAMLQIWKNSTPGPHLDDEAAGLINVGKLSLSIGGTFVSVMREAMNGN